MSRYEVLGVVPLEGLQEYKERKVQEVAERGQSSMRSHGEESAFTHQVMGTLDRFSIEI